MTPSPKTRRTPRLLCALFAVLIAAGALTFTPAAATPTEQQQKQTEEKLKEFQRKLAEAQQRAKVLGREITQTRMDLDALRGKVAGLEGEVQIATKQYEALQAKLDETESKQADVQLSLDDTQAAMDARVRAAYMDGPSGTLDLLFGSDSVGDMADRGAFLNALHVQDANTAATLDVLGDELRKLAHDQHQASKDAERALEILRKERYALEDARNLEADKLVELNKQYHEAHMLEVEFGKKVEVTTKKLLYDPNADGPFWTCPVPDYDWIADDFGAPRYAGGYHTHQGNDIGANAGADIVAPFDGIAKQSTNTLGGLSVNVYGKDGYVYNAHLSSYEGSYPRHVSVGEVVGHVGMTGDAQGTVNHDHFEWHPNNGSAVDPHPNLMEVCHK